MLEDLPSWKKYVNLKQKSQICKLENCEVLQRCEEKKQKNLGLAGSDSAERILGT